MAKKRGPESPFIYTTIRKFTLNFSKKIVKGKNEDRNFLESELKKMEKNLNSL